MKGRLVPIIREGGYRIATVVAEHHDSGEVTLEILTGQTVRFQTPQDGQPGDPSWQSFRLYPGWEDALERKDVLEALEMVHSAAVLAAAARDDMNRAKQMGMVSLNRVLGLLTGEKETPTDE